MALSFSWQFPFRARVIRGFMKNTITASIILVLTLSACSTIDGSLSRGLETDVVPSDQSSGSNQIAAQIPVVETGFAQDGKAEFASPNRFVPIGLQSTGKLVGFSSSRTEGKTVITLRRLNATGSEDSSFSATEKPVLQAANSTLDERFMMVLPNNKILIILYSALPGSPQLLRLDQDGQLDTTFGENGYVQLEQKYISTRNIAPLANGDLVIHVLGPAVSQPRLIRLDSFGKLDDKMMPSYSIPKLPMYGFEDYNMASPSGIQPLQTGQFLVRLFIKDIISDKYGYGVALRISENGTLDQSFAPVVAEPPTGIQQVIELDDGYVMGINNMASGRAELRHIGPDGKEIGSFVTCSIGDASLVSMFMDSEDRLVTLFMGDGISGLFLQRFTKQGAPDITFGDQGVYKTGKASLETQTAFFGKQHLFVWSVFGSSLEPIDVIHKLKYN
jgi:uncharacterized delta-60 repeat protein